ncbi:MAG TPA: phosphoenolpyruvate--protein phosphotransferase, partial [Candidatus Kapabacteria bacterium]|nr:phosphoenolpyruvate--protein phosphotransferase [Candidatus Kapabacteria bacterium]
REICERAYPKPVTIRVFDLGSDKYVEGLPIKEFNPALGLRGIRFLLSRQDIFKTQLRALLRASMNKNLKIMLPMITSLHEVELSRKILEMCKNELQQEGVLFDNLIPLGVMIETPAAAVISDGLAKVADFFSIGTNDLTQYTLAADRNNELVSDIFDDFHPSVLRLIDFIIKTAHKNGITVSICGELAGHAAATQLLVGMDVDELSVAPSLLLELKNRVRSLTYSEAKLIAEDILNSNDYFEVRKKLEKAIGRHSVAEINEI